MPDDTTLPRDKNELLERIQQARSELAQAINRLSDDQLTEQRDADGWSTKEHLAHLAAWERSITYLLRGRPRHEGLGVDEATYRGAGEDGINAVIYRQYRDRPLPEVRAIFEETHQHLLAVLGGLTDADLFKTYSHYLPDEPGKDSGAPILDWIVGNTYEHYREHAAWIKALTE